MLQVFVNNLDLSSPDCEAPLASIRRIDFRGLEGDDWLIVDSRFGLIDLPDQVHYYGGAITDQGNQLTLKGGKDNNNLPALN